MLWCFQAKQTPFSVFVSLFSKIKKSQKLREMGIHNQNSTQISCCLFIQSYRYKKKIAIEKGIHNMNANEKKCAIQY